MLGLESQSTNLENVWVSINYINIENMSDKSTNISVNLNVLIVVGYILLALGWHILQSRWIMGFSLFLFVATFIMSMYYALINRKFNEKENNSKKIFIAGLRASFLSFSFALINIYRLCFLA